MGEPESTIQTKKYPWWLWPNLLALDAPTIAVIWQRYFVKIFSVQLEWFISGILFGIVWGIYLLDRWFDALPYRSLEAGDRHRFARSHRWYFKWMSIFILGTSCSVAILVLPIHYLLIGGLIAIFALIYFILVHLVTYRFLTQGEKELLVGLLFALGVGLPLIVESWKTVAEWGICLLGFGGLCWLNCQLIDRWESSRETQNFHSFHPITIGAVSILFSIRAPVLLFIPISISVILLLGFDLLRNRLSNPLKRVLADLALFTPLLFIWIR
jgi:hypothetical protein